jgi:biopolymer transport protein ExbD
MAFQSSDEDEITGINVTPLVDIMLVLLVIFMVTSNYIAHRSISLKLPEAETSDEQVSSQNLGFSLTKDEKLFLDGQEISFSEVGAKIEQIKNKNENKVSLQALIAADQEVSHGSVVKLIDTIRKSGINDFAINVETEKKATP